MSIFINFYSKHFDTYQYDLWIHIYNQNLVIPNRLVLNLMLCKLHAIFNKAISDNFAWIRNINANNDLQRN